MSKDYFRKPYLNPEGSDYVSNMKRVTEGAVRASGQVFKHSEFKKPYLSKNGYRAMEDDFSFPQTKPYKSLNDFDWGSDTELYRDPSGRGYRKPPPDEMGDTGKGCGGCQKDMLPTKPTDVSCGKSVLITTGFGGFPMRLAFNQSMGDVKLISSTVIESCADRDYGFQTFEYTPKCDRSAGGFNNGVQEDTLAIVDGSGFCSSETTMKIKYNDDQCGGIKINGSDTIAASGNGQYAIENIEDTTGFTWSVRQLEDLPVNATISDTGLLTTAGACGTIEVEAADPCGNIVFNKQVRVASGTLIEISSCIPAGACLTCESWSGGTKNRSGFCCAPSDFVPPCSAVCSVAGDPSCVPANPQWACIWAVVEQWVCA